VAHASLQPQRKVAPSRVTIRLPMTPIRPPSTQEPTLMTTAAIATPVARAQAESERRMLQYEQAKRDLLEQVRVSDGYVAGGIVDQVADSTGTPAAVVQRAMWDLLRHGVLEANEQLAVVLRQTPAK
jgi:hypothetical protein